LNIFVLDRSPVAAARYHVDKHCVKQVLEVAQLLSTAIRLTGGDYGYKVSHPNHPCSIWARTTKANFGWLQHLGMELCWEYTHRYGKEHKSQPIIFDAPNNTIPDGALTPFAQAMPDEYKHEDPVVAYRQYYAGAKSRMFAWKNRQEPEWLKDYEHLYIRAGGDNAES